MKIERIEAQACEFYNSRPEAFSAETEIALESEFGILGMDPDQISIPLDFTAGTRTRRKVADLDFTALKADRYFWTIKSAGINLSSWKKYRWTVIHWSDGTKTHSDTVRMQRDNEEAKRHGQPPQWREVA